MIILAQHNYLVTDDFNSNDLFQSIMSYFGDMENRDKLQKAGIGSSVSFKSNWLFSDILSIG